MYEIDTAKATDVLGVESLSDTDYQPVTKRLGPAGPDGERTLVLVSDNNFSDVQTMEFIAFAVRT